MGHEFHTEFKNNIQVETRHIPFDLCIRFNKEKEKKKRERRIIKIILLVLLWCLCKLFFWHGYISFNTIEICWKSHRGTGCLNHSPSTRFPFIFVPDVRPFVGYGIALGQCIFQIRTTWSRWPKPDEAACTRPRNNR